MTLRHAATGGGYDSVAPVEVRVTITQPATAPGVPRTLTATPGDGEVVLTWTAPASDGGETITRYEYRHKATSSLPFVSSDSWTSAGTARTATVGSLTNGTPYSFEVRAVNTVGEGTAASASATTAGTANNAPVFTDGTSTTRSVAENTASGQDIGTAIAATDADSGDTLEYTLGGTDAASFAIVSTSGQLQTSAALDYETTSSYAVTVSVLDGNGGSDSISVTITVMDVAEQPATPGAPTVSATAGSTTSLDVSWSAPGLNGGPALTGYHLQYRPGTSGSFTNGPQNVSGTSTAITGLTAGTSYQVQVRALNGEFPSDWSPSGTGSTSPATATAPGVPRTLAAAPGNGQVVLTWTAPASTGGSAILRYEHRHKVTSAANFPPHLDERRHGADRDGRQPHQRRALQLRGAGGQHRGRRHGGHRERHAAGDGEGDPPDTHPRRCSHSLRRGRRQRPDLCGAERAQHSTHHGAGGHRGRHGDGAGRLRRV